MERWLEWGHDIYWFRVWSDVQDGSCGHHLGFAWGYIWSHERPSILVIYGLSSCFSINLKYHKNKITYYFLLHSTVHIHLKRQYCKCLQIVYLKNEYLLQHNKQHCKRHHELHDADKPEEAAQTHSDFIKDGALDFRVGPRLFHCQIVVINQRHVEIKHFFNILNSCFNC